MELFRSREVVKKWFLLWPTGDDFEADDQMVLRTPPRTPRQGSGSSASVCPVRERGLPTGTTDEERFDTAPGSPVCDNMPSSPTAEELMLQLYKKSCSLHVDPKKLKPQYTEEIDVKVFVGTWNLGGNGAPPEGLTVDNFLDIENPADIYVIGFQEIVELNFFNVVGAVGAEDDSSAVAAWESLISRTLNERMAPVNSSRAASAGDITGPNSPMCHEEFVGTPPLFRLPTCAVTHVEPHPFPPPVSPREPLEAVRGGATSATEEAPVDEVPSPPCVPDVEGRRYGSVGSPEWRGLSPSTPNRWRSTWSPPRCPRNASAPQLASPGRSSPSRSWSQIASQVQSGMASFAGRIAGMKTSSDISELPLLSDEDESGRLPRAPCGSPPNSNTSVECMEKQYVWVASKQMVGVHICVWVRAELKKHVHSVKTCSIATGTLNFGNKGAVAVSMSVHDTSMCFVCSHLSSGDTEGAEKKRNEEVHKILQSTKFPRIVKIDVPETILNHDRCIWLGDLNYRLNKREDGLARECIAREDYNSLLEADQLKVEMDKDHVFLGWEEGEITFAPTFKFERWTDMYIGDPRLGPRKDTKTRVPAWCDRILWRGDKMTQEWYNSTNDAFSDHRPVRSMFTVTVCTLIMHKVEAVLLAERARLDALERESHPMGAIHPHNLNLGEVKYGQLKTAKAELLNTGSAVACWQVAVNPDPSSPCLDWLTPDPREGVLKAGEIADIKVEAFVSTSSVQIEEVLERNGLLEGVLVIRLDGGGDLFLACSATYLPSAWGLRLERLAALQQPVRSTKFIRGGTDIALPPPQHNAPTPASTSATSATDSESTAQNHAESASVADTSTDSSVPAAKSSPDSSAQVADSTADSSAQVADSSPDSSAPTGESVPDSSAPVAESIPESAPLAADKTPDSSAPESEGTVQESATSAPVADSSAAGSAVEAVSAARDDAESASEAENKAREDAPSALATEATTASSATEAEEGEVEGEAEREGNGVPVASLVPKEITRMVDYLLSDGVRETPNLLNPRSLVQQQDHAASHTPESQLDTETAEMLWRLDWTEMSVRSEVEEKIGEVREAIDRGADFPATTTGPLVGAALLSLLNALPQPVITSHVWGLMSADPGFGKDGATAAIEGCGLPPVHLAVLHALLDLVHGLLQNWQSNHVTLSLATIMLSSAVFSSAELDERSKELQRRFVRQLIEEKLKNN